MDLNLAPCLKHDHYPPRRMSSCTHEPEETGSDWELILYVVFGFHGCSLEMHM